MIHYTLLPKEEMKLLRREYRIRLCIIGLFFLSCAMVLGIAALMPSYLYTKSQEKSALIREAEIEKSRKASGADQIEKDLIQSQAIAETILADGETAVYADTIQKILAHRTSPITLSAFEIIHDAGTSTPVEVTIQGKATTRETLLEFKKSLELDTAFSQIDLPLSDLAKSSNVFFSMHFNLTKKQ